ncbi:MAG: APC family permease [Chloroflexi bacterium]|nr:APC family permease [Chloroflexota bacterium]
MAESAATAQKVELRRDVSVWGSYTWGYADVGADIYAALGLVIAAAQGLAPAAFAFAGLVYIMIGLAYTELASTYPVAGGGQYFTLRGLGDFWGFVTGSALLLDYTIDIALFAVASAGYINFFAPFVLGVDIGKVSIAIGPFADIKIIWLAETMLLIAFLIVVNIRGVRESSLLNEVLGGVDLVLESSVVFFGFVLAWNPQFLLQQWTLSFQTLPIDRFMYGSSLAIISFVGLESISQAAQETRRPATVIPRTSIALIFTVFIFALSFSTVGLGILPWQHFAQNIGDPVAELARAIPFLGIIAGPFAAILGATILLISANTGVMGASRLTFSMSQLHLASKWLDKVHPRFHTPVRTIVVFSLMGAAEAFLSFLTPSALDTLGNMYAFGATLGYTLVFVSLIVLRFKDPYSPRPYIMPFNAKINWRGRRVDFPVLGVVGMIGVSFILFEVILTHEIGRIAGPAWVLLCIAYYILWRRRNKLTLLGNVHHDWEAEQIQVLTSAEEFELLEEYKDALARRDKITNHAKPTSTPDAVHTRG